MATRASTPNDEDLQGDRSEMRADRVLPATAGPRREIALSLVIFAVIALAFFHIELTGTETREDAPAIGDLLTYYYPTLKYGFGELRRGELPLWNPHQSCGSPFIAALHEGFFYPLYAPFLVLGAETAIDAHIVLHLIIASLGTFVFCRHLGLGFPAALLAGLVYAYQGSMMIKVYFPDFLTSCAWIPWLVLCVDRALQRPTMGVAAGLAIVLGMSFLGGHGAQFLYLAAWALLPLAVVRTFGRLRADGPRGLVGSYAALTVGAALGILIALVRILPNGELVSHSSRPAGSLPSAVAALVHNDPDVFREGVLTPEPSPTVGVFARRNADTLRRVYVGIVTLGLSLIGLTSRASRGALIAIGAAGIGAVLYSFGQAGFVFPLLYRLPAGAWFRGVDRALIFFGLAVAVLSGAGVDVLSRRQFAAGRGAVRSRVAVLAAIAFAAGAVLAAGLLFGAPRGTATLIWYSGCAVLLLGFWALSGNAALRAVAFSGLALLVLVDLFHAQEHPGRLPSQLDGAFSRNDDFYEAIRERQGLARTYIWSCVGVSCRDPGSAAYSLRFYTDTAKAGLNHGIWMITDYEPLSDARFVRFLSEFELGVPSIGYAHVSPSRKSMKLLELMGVRFFLLTDWRAEKMLAENPELAARWTLIKQRDGISLYELSGAVPRAFVVERITIEPDPERVLALLDRSDPLSAAFVEEPIAELAAAAEPRGRGLARAAIAEYSPNRVVIDVDGPAAGFLVLTDQYDAGWHAAIDGAATKVYRADYLFRGVTMPAGSHRIVFTYRPTSFVAGAAGSLIGVLLTAALALGAAMRWRA